MRQNRVATWAKSFDGRDCLISVLSNTYMQIPTKFRNVYRRIVQLYGSSSMKRRQWDNEFATGHWQCLESTPGDFVYAVIEKHANRGDILDLGCGSGSTGMELDASAYQTYTGVDISAVATDHAAERSVRAGRSTKNKYFQSDILLFVPSGSFDVILLRDSIYYVPTTKIIDMLRRYGAHLKTGGVFIARLHDADEQIISLVQLSFKLLKRIHYIDLGSVDCFF